MHADPAWPDLRSLPLDQLGRFLERLGEKPYRARQIYRSLHRRGAGSFEEMTDLPAQLRRRLCEGAVLATLEMAQEMRSADGTIKWKWRTADGMLLESVYLPERSRKTLCVSSQVGCALGCTFCLTGTMGLERNLSPGEIVDQVARANRRLAELGEGQAPRPLTNLVFMGMGEPLQNYQSLKAALDILLSEDGPNFSHRHVTVSTSGLVPQMRRLGEETEVKLAVSLNATTDAQRTALMPINRRYPIAQLLDACRAFPMKRGRRITFEYVLLSGVNDTDADAARLACLIRGIPAKVNLIAYNENPGLGFTAPNLRRLESFHEILIARQVTAVFRRSRGLDISAACGQLAALPERQERGKGAGGAPVRSSAAGDGVRPVDQVARTR